MLDKKRNNVIKIHQELSKTLRDLKSFLPSGFIKINIFSSRISPIRHKPIIINYKTEKQINSKNSKELKKSQSKNEYLLPFGHVLSAILAKSSSVTDEILYWYSCRSSSFSDATSFSVVGC